MLVPKDIMKRRPDNSFVSVGRGANRPIKGERLCCDLFFFFLFFSRVDLVGVLEISWVHGCLVFGGPLPPPKEKHVVLRKPPKKGILKKGTLNGQTPKQRPVDVSGCRQEQPLPYKTLDVCCCAHVIIFWGIIFSLYRS